MLRAPSDLQHLRGLSLLAVAQGDTDPRLAQVLPGRLDQQPARVARARLRDRTLTAALTRLVERGDKSEPTRQLRGSAKADEVADLERKHQGRQRVDPPEATQPRHRLGPLTLEREPREALVERNLARDQTIDRGERVQISKLRDGLVEALAAEPAAVTLVPGRRSRVDTAVQKQQLRDAVTAAHQVSTHLLTRTAKVTGGLERRARHRDRLQLASQQKPRQQLRVLAVTLDPIAARTRRLARRHDADVDPGRLRRPVKREASRAGLIADPQRPRQPRQPRNHLLAAAAETSAPQPATHQLDNGGVDRAGVDVEPHACHRCGHGRTLPPCMGSAGASLRPDKPPIYKQWVRL